MRTTISPRQWQPWTAVSLLLGLMVVRMRKVLATPRSWYVCFGAVNWFQIYLGTQVNFSDTISIRMPWENCFAVPYQQLPRVYGGAYD